MQCFWLISTMYVAFNYCKFFVLLLVISYLSSVSLSYLAVRFSLFSFLQACISFSVSGDKNYEYSMVAYIKADITIPWYISLSWYKVLVISPTPNSSSNQTSLLLLLLFPKTKSLSVNMERMELKKVSMEADDESSVDERFTSIDSEKATINRSESLTLFDVHI